MSRKRQQVEEEGGERDWENTDYLKDVKYDTKLIAPAEYKAFKTAFSYLDKDGSNRISADELKKELNSIRKEVEKKYPDFDYEAVVDYILEACDENGDGEVDFKEFLNIMVQDPCYDLSDKETCKKVYKEFTKTGPLTAKNLTKIANELGDKMQTPEGCEKMVFYADLDEDKEVSFEEFYDIINKSPDEYHDKAIEWSIKTKEPAAAKGKKGKR